MNENPEILTIEQIENYPAARLLRFVGDLDSTNAEATSNRILALLNDNNSTGLGALLFVNKKVKEIGGVFKVANGNENVLEIIEIIGADQLLEIYASLEDALRTLN